MIIKKITRFVSIASLFLIPVFPLIVVDWFLFPFITGKAFYFRILVEIAFSSWVILAFLDAKYRPRLNTLTIGVTLFAIVSLIADLLGVNPIRSLWSNNERMEGWLMIIHLWMFFIASTSIFGAETNEKSKKDSSENRKMWHYWFNTSLAFATIVGFYGIGQLLGWFEIHQGSTRIDASLGNAIYMAVYMLFHVFIAGYLFFLERSNGASASKIKLWLYGLFVLLGSFLIFQTATRGTILGLVIGLVIVCLSYALFASGINYKKILVALTYPIIIVAVLIISGSLSFWFIAILSLIYLAILTTYVHFDRKNIKIEKTQKGRWIGIGIILAIIALVIGFYLIKDSQFVKDSEVLNRLAGISLTESKTQARGFVWPMAIKGWTQRPIFGWGQENFNYVFNANYDPLMWHHEQWFDRAHNIYLDWLINGGIVGLLSYLSLYILAAVAIWKSSATIIEKSLFSGLLIGYAINNIFVFDNLASYVFFFAILGFVSTFDYAKPRIGGSKDLSTEIVNYIVMPVSVIVLVFCLYFFNFRAMQASARLIAAMTSCNSPTPDLTLFDKAFKVNVYNTNQEIREYEITCIGDIIKAKKLPETAIQIAYEMAQKSINDQITITPNDARMYVLGGFFYFSIGQYQQAMQLLEKAHQLSPKKQSISLQLAIAYLNVGEVEKAMSLMKETYQFDPSHTSVRTAYAMILVISEKESEARELFKDTPEIFDSKQMIEVYVQIKEYDKAVKAYKKLIEQDKKNIQLRAGLANVLYIAGRKWEAIQVLEQVKKDFPEYTAQAEAGIKELQK